MQELNFRPDLNHIALPPPGVPVYGTAPGAPSDEHPRPGISCGNQAGDNLRVFGARSNTPRPMGKRAGHGAARRTIRISGDMGLFKPSDSARGQDLYLCVSPSARRNVSPMRGDYRRIPHLPAKWDALAELRAIASDHLIPASRFMEEARIFRNKKLPCDALIFLVRLGKTVMARSPSMEAVFPDPRKR